MPVPVVVAAAAGLSYWLMRRRRGAGAQSRQMTYELDDALPAPVRERVLHLLALAGGGETASTTKQALREMARVLSVGYPHTARSLRRKLWELGRPAGRATGVRRAAARRCAGHGLRAGRNYSSGPLGYGTGPEGLDRGMPGAMAARVRERLVESRRARPSGDELPARPRGVRRRAGWRWLPVAAETIRSKANYCKRQFAVQGRGTRGLHLPTRRRLGSRRARVCGVVPRQQPKTGTTGSCCKPLRTGVRMDELPAAKSGEPTSRRHRLNL